MISYATYADLIQFTSVDVDEEERATALLSSASAMVASLLVKSGKEAASTDEIENENRKTVVCMMVSRAMSADGETYGLSQQQQMAGSYMVMNSFANPSGDLYLTASEKKLLGIGSQRRRYLMPIGMGDE